MHHTRLLPRAPLLVVGLALAFVGPAAAQEAAKPKPEAPEVDLLDPTGQEGKKAEMIRLFHEVERTLTAIDVELADAGAGGIPIPEGKDSGIDRLLRSTSTKSDQAVVGIDKILELAAKMGGKGCGT